MSDRWETVTSAAERSGRFFKFTTRKRKIKPSSNMWEGEPSYLAAKVAFGGPIFNSLLHTWVGLSSKRNLYTSGEEIQSPADWGDLMVAIATGG